MRRDQQERAVCKKLDLANFVAQRAERRGGRTTGTGLNVEASSLGTQTLSKPPHSPPAQTAQSFPAGWQKPKAFPPHERRESLRQKNSPFERRRPRRSAAARPASQSPSRVQDVRRRFET